MIDYRAMRNEEMVRNVRRKLYSIICEHVKHFDDENAMTHIERFLEGVSWAMGLRYAVRGDGEIYVYFKGSNRAEMCLFNVWYEIKALRKSINRHYHKMGGMF